MSDSGLKWKVISQPLASGQDASGNFVRGRNVNYQLAGGATGQVFVPASLYTPEAVRAAIEADAVNVAAISELSSDS